MADRCPWSRRRGGTIRLDTTVEIEASDVLDELSDAELAQELDARGKERVGSVSVADLRSAFYRRDASTFEALMARMDPEKLPAERLTKTPIAAVAPKVSPDDTHH
jgi:hypothetical protein